MRTGTLACPSPDAILAIGWGAALIQAYYCTSSCTYDDGQRAPLHAYRRICRLVSSSPRIAMSSRHPPPFTKSRRVPRHSDTPGVLRIVENARYCADSAHTDSTSAQTTRDAARHASSPTDDVPNARDEFRASTIWSGPTLTACI